MNTLQITTITAVIASTISCFIGAHLEKERIQLEAIAKKVAYYHPQTGKFTWVEIPPESSTHGK